MDIAEIMELVERLRKRHAMRKNAWKRFLVSQGRLDGAPKGNQNAAGPHNMKHKASATGENSPCKGFASKTKRKDHAKRHGKALGCKNQKEYQKKGIDFLSQPCGGDVIGYATEDGKVVRFNTKTTEYASGYPGGNLCTYMKAKARRNGSGNPDTAMKYYQTFKKKDGVNDG